MRHGYGVRAAEVLLPVQAVPELKAAAPELVLEQKAVPPAEEPVPAEGELSAEGPVAG